MSHSSGQNKDEETSDEGIENFPDSNTAVANQKLADAKNKILSKVLYSFHSEKSHSRELISLKCNILFTLCYHLDRKEKRDGKCCSDRHRIEETSRETSISSLRRSDDSSQRTCDRLQRRDQRFFISLSIIVTDVFMEDFNQ